MKKKISPKNIWAQTKKIVLLSVSVGLIFVALGLGTALLFIRNTINEVCQNAQNKYNGTCSQSLVKLIQSSGESFHDKNDAIWTLGRMRSQDALGALQEIYTGIIPDREPYDEMVSQYEIRKALLRIDSNFDVSPRVGKSLKEKLQDCLPKSDMGSKETCDNLIKTITNFSQCSEAGFFIEESNPPQCSTPDGRRFFGTKQ